MRVRNIAELTAGALGLGIVLSLLMYAANTYLGLYAGMTVSASIPAAVVGMVVLFRSDTLQKRYRVVTAP